MRVVPPFNLSVESGEAEAVVHLHGELDVATASQLKQCVEDLLGQGTCRLTADVSDLEFIDSNGIHALVISLKRLREHGGELTLRAPTPSIYKVLEIVGLTEVIPIVRA